MPHTAPRWPVAISLLALAACSTRTREPDVAPLDRRIWCLLQAQDGDYWFGSNGRGVYRFDGERVSHYDHERGLAGDQVRGIHQARNGDLLVSTNRGVSRFDGSRFEAVPFVAEPTPASAWRLDPDDLWLVYEPGVRGPVRYDGHRLHHMQLTESPAIAQLRARQPWPSYDPAGVYSVHRDRRGHLWFGTAGAGLCRYDGRELSWMVEQPLSTTPSGGEFGIRSIFEDRAGDYWICNTRHRFTFARESELRDGHRWLRYRREPGLPDASADDDENFLFYPAITEDRSGALWMACGGDGVTRLRDGRVTRYPLPSEAYACCILCDRDDRIWIGTLEHGIYVLDGDRFEPFRAPGKGS